MMLDIAIEADAEWDSSSGWEALVRRAAEAAWCGSAFGAAGATALGSGEHHHEA